MTDVLRCPNMKDLLAEPRSSPLASNNTYWEGRFVDDADRVALNVMDFASPNSTGAHPQCLAAISNPGTLPPLDPAELENSLAEDMHFSTIDMESAAVGAGSHEVCMPLPPFAIRAGPREQICFDPATVTAAIITTGNLCPGMNIVIQSMVKRLWDYNVPEENVLGIRYGMRGFREKDAKPVVLTRDKIEGIQLMAAVADRQSDELEHILDKLEFWRINMLLVIGGQGGNQLAAQLADGCRRRRIPCCIVGVPKSIDNDVMLLDKTFGFETVVQEVNRPLLAAKVEAASARKGVGLVKSSLSSGVVDVCLIPEEPFELDGPAGVLNYVRKIIEQKGHCVVCVAEGAGQDLLYPPGETIAVDEAGNPLLRDIGTYLKKAIKAHIPDADIKYIDPTYMVQAVPCNSADQLFCRILGMHAVDAAFAGYTGVMVGQVNGHFVLLPQSVVTLSARRVDPKGKTWNRLRGAIGQPRFKNNSPADMPAEKAAVRL
eukprot:gene13373-13500_t